MAHLQALYRVEHDVAKYDVLGTPLPLARRSAYPLKLHLVWRLRSLVSTRQRHGVKA